MFQFYEKITINDKNLKSFFVSLFFLQHHTKVSLKNKLKNTTQPTHATTTHNNENHTFVSNCRVV